MCVSRTTWKPIQQRQSTEGKPGCKTSSMRSLVTYTVEWRVLKSSSSVARRRRLDDASSWFAGGVTGRCGCCNTRRLLIIQSTHARLLLLYMTTTSSHSTRRTAAATLRPTLTTRRTWATVTFGPCITGMWLGSRVVSVLDSGTEGQSSNRSRDAVG